MEAEKTGGSYSTFVLAQRNIKSHNHSHELCSIFCLPGVSG